MMVRTLLTRAAISFLAAMGLAAPALGDGACCFLDGSCTEVVLETQCEAVGGMYQGDGSTCAVDGCPGACCLADGSCATALDVDACKNDGGSYQGFGTDCVDVFCGMGACCFDDETCADVLKIVCDGLGGIHLGADTDCATIEVNAATFEEEIAGVFTIDVPLPLFDPTGGRTLERVFIAADHVFLATIEIENLSVGGELCDTRVSLAANVVTELEDPPAFGDPLAIAILQLFECDLSDPVLYPNGCLAAHDGDVGVCGIPCDLCMFDSESDTGIGLQSTSVPTEVADFVGPGIFTTTVTAFAQYTRVGSQAASFDVENLGIRGLVKVIYEFSVAGGACCLTDGTCVEVESEDACNAQGGEFQGIDTLCSDPDIECGGACCNPNGSCTENTTEVQCEGGGGQWQGALTECTNESCPAACCFKGGFCDDLPRKQCKAEGGTWQGFRSECAQVDCPRACCFPEAVCEELTPLACRTAGGQIQGLGVSCNSDPCPEDVEACCLINGICIVTTVEACVAQGGLPQGMGVTCTVTLCREACCLPDGSCQNVRPDYCVDELGGMPQGPGSHCLLLNCGGACCLPDGSCSVELHADCIAMGGLYQGEGTTCIPGLCPALKGACCFPSGACAVISQEMCVDMGGVYGGDDTVCVPDLCPPPKGACCFDDGTCEALTQLECFNAGGVYQGNETDCAPGLCPQPKGACCLPDGACAQLTQEECTNQGGLYQGDGTPCEPGLCPAPGACCLPDGTCKDDSEQEDCIAIGGTFQGVGTVCDPDLCPPLKGACCLPSGECTVIPEQDCLDAGGEYLDDGTVCEPDICRKAGACCLANGTCLDDVEEDDCTASGGTYQDDDTLCADVECLGACCFDDGSCLVLDLDDCNAEGGRYEGFGTACEDVICIVEGSCCDFGKPRVLTMRYTGEDCSATQHEQDPGKVECDDFGPLGDPVYIVSSDSDDPFDGGADVWFEGWVDLNATYDIDAANAGQSKLDSNTWVHILAGPGGPVLQTVKFHTSCSQPLERGYQFGASLLVNCIGEDEGDCCAAGLETLLFEYNALDCSFTSHGQAPGKVVCEDFGPLEDDVHILVTNKSNPFDGGANVFFQGDVSTGDSYLADASDFSGTTFIHVLSQAGGTQLQRLEFHTSCSQPIREGDQLGASLILACNVAGAAAPETRDPARDRVDITGDGTVNSRDLAAVLGWWGACLECPADVNGDGVVDGRDLELVIAAWR